MIDLHLETDDQWHVANALMIAANALDFKIKTAAAPVSVIQSWQQQAGAFRRIRDRVLGQEGLNAHKHDKEAE